MFVILIKIPFLLVKRNFVTKLILKHANILRNDCLLNLLLSSLGATKSRAQNQNVQAQTTIDQPSCSFSNIFNSVSDRKLIDTARQTLTISKTSKFERFILEAKRQTFVWWYANLAYPVGKICVPLYKHFDIYLTICSVRT